MKTRTLSRRSFRQTYATTSSSSVMTVPSRLPPGWLATMSGCRNLKSENWCDATRSVRGRNAVDPASPPFLCSAAHVSPHTSLIAPATDAYWPSSSPASETVPVPLPNRGPTSSSEV
jgi:hypothetical protein